MASDVKWIKIVTDVFDDEKILMIETMPECDTIIVIWFKLLCLAGKQNNGGVFQMGQIPYTDEMFAAIFRRPINTVRLALNTFEKFGMIEIIRDTVTIPNWGKHQSLDAYEKKKERDRERIARKRAEQKALIEMSPDMSPDKSPDVAPLEGEEDKEKEGDKELYISIVSYLNEKAGTKYKATTDKTKKAIHARLSEGFTVEDFKTVIDKKCAEWIGDSKMEKYLRPETLFGTKFEGYLNAKTTGRNETNGQAARDSSKVRVGNYI